VQTPTLSPQTEPERVLLIPEAEEPRTTRLLIVLLSLALVAAMALGGGLVYAWQQGHVRDSDQAAHAARVDAADAQSQAAADLARADSLQAQVTALDQQVAKLQSNQSILEGKNADAAGQAQRAIDRMNQAQAELRAVTGPSVPNGRHIAYLLSAGTAQSPPMIVMDLGRWYTGDAARRAATADGALTSGKHLFHGRYLRNTGNDWRILQVGSGALFTIRHYGGAIGETNVSLTTLAAIMASTDQSNVRIAHDPFWVQVRNGVVMSGRQQEYRAP
jgi:hypothetical protein